MIENGVLIEYKGTSGDVIIPNCVTIIGDNAFIRCSSLTNITIPDSVTSIGFSAFKGCSKLKIHGHAGSCTELYAKKNNISFIAE